MKKSIFAALGLTLMLSVPSLAFAKEETKNITLPASESSYLTSENKELLSTLFAVFPIEVFEQSNEMMNYYIEDPNKPYQDRLDKNHQNLYYLNLKNGIQKETNCYIFRWKALD